MTVEGQRPQTYLASLPPSLSIVATRVCSRFRHQSNLAGADLVKRRNPKSS
jgi:hypothetical protein